MTPLNKIKSIFKNDSARLNYGKKIKNLGTGYKKKEIVKIKKLKLATANKLT